MGRRLLRGIFRVMGIILRYVELFNLFLYEIKEGLLRFLIERTERIRS